MKCVGLVDVDGTGFPNLCLMKLSSYFRGLGYGTELLKPSDVLLGQSLFTPYDTLYGACVFSGKESVVRLLREAGVIVGGTGSGSAFLLPGEVECCFPDYALYGITDVAYGFLTRGCPRGCPFCIVGDKEGRKSYKVSNLSGFWNGQEKIVLLDPNLLACPGHMDLLRQLVDSRALVDFSQGLDIRLMNDSIVDLLNSMRIKRIHFAWDNPRDTVVPDKLADFRKKTRIKEDKFLSVYVLTNYWSTFEEDLYRVYWLRDHGFDPYVMIYNKEKAPRNIRLLQRYVNNKRVFRVVKKFEDFDPALA